ncbi:MAG TPA: SBBP repeat-containing protein [Candidatus Dormibacteraeota bacterium]|nr:SBBP repeat-containing protein [Candidatus Dormibacteraeota bacterium]
MQSKGALAQKLSQLPLTFERNEGQVSSPAKFIARGKNYKLLLGSAEAVFSVNSAIDIEHASPGANNPRSIRMQFAGANKNAAITGLEKSGATTNYFIGNNPEKWRTGIPSYRNIKVQNLYDGIDLLYYGKGTELEHDLIVAPKKDPAAIKISFAEAESLQVGHNGDLIVKAPAGELHLKKPKIYQKIGNSNRDIEGGYLLSASNEVGFHIGEYDANKPLVIDPVLEFSTYFGGNEEDVIIGIAVDPSGNIYVAGGTSSTDFPLKNPLQSALNPSLCGAAPNTFRCGSGFISKLNPAGNSLIYSTYFGGTGTGGEAVRTVAVDAQENVYLVGITTATDFPVTSGAYSTQYTAGTCPGFACREGFVAKLAPSGSALIYSTYLGAPGDSVAETATVDGLGQVYVTGTTSSTSFPTTPGTFQTTCTLLTPPAPQQCFVAFVTALNAAGSALVYSTYFGDNTTVNAIAVDANGSAVFAGSVTPGSLPLVNALQTQPAPGFFAKLKPDGSGLLFSSYLGGTVSGRAANQVAISGLALDSFGNIYMTGQTSSLNFPTTPGAFQETVTSTGGYFGFVTKIDKSGSAPLAYSTYLTGQAVVNPVSSTGTLGIAVDSAGQAYVIGATNQSDFPQMNSLLPSYAAAPCVNPGSFQCTHAFVSELNSQGTGLVFSTFLGGSNVDAGFAIAVDQSHAIYAAGDTNSTDFPVLNAFQATPGGGTSCPNSAPCFDGFVAKIQQPGLVASPGSLAFPLQLVGTQSTAQQITITNTSTQSIQILSVTTAGDFSENDGCIGTLSAGSSCVIHVFFSPTASGQRTGTLTLTDGGVGGPINISLTGQGSAPAASVSPDTFSFIPVSQGATEGPVPITLTSNGTAPLHISSVALSGTNPGDFSQTNNCVGTVLAVNATCTINVSFTPSAETARTATLVITDDAVVSTQSVALQGTGTAPFQVAPAANSSTTAAVTAGQTANYSLQLNPNKGFAGNVSLACSGAPTAAKCTVTPASVSVTSATAANISVSISTTGSSSALGPIRSLPFLDLRFYPAFAAWLVFLLLIWMNRTKDVARKLSASAILSVLAIFLFASGCGGGSTSITPPPQITPKGSYTITVNATANNLPTQSISLTLTVN